MWSAPDEPDALDRYRPACRGCHRRPVDAVRAVRLYRAGASLRGIAALLDVSTATVRRTLRTHDVATRRHQQHRAPATETTQP